MLQHQPCPDCGSHDALSIYDDGHTYCFSCETYHRSSEQEQKLSPNLRAKDTLDTQAFVLEPLPKRGITKATCQKYGYFKGVVHGKPAQIACYYNDDGVLIGQKIRYADKTFEIRGKLQDRFFGQHLFQGGGKKLVITEGEIDALTVSQVQGNKYPVVSIPNGANSIKKCFKANFDWLESFEEVIVMTDMDEPGRKAARDIQGILSPHRLKIASLPLKDPNECLLQGKADAIIKSIWDAKEYRPADIINGSDMWDMLSKVDEDILSYPLPWENIDLQSMTDGIRKGELVTITAGTGIGKTTFVRQLAYHLGMKCFAKVGMLMLEENVKRTAKGLMALYMQKNVRYIKPTDDKFHEAFDAVLGSNNFTFYEHFGSLSSDSLLQAIRYMITVEECDIIILDHISIAISGLEITDERKATDVLMTKLRSLVEETGAGMLVVSHLRRTDGTPAEEGGSLSLSHLRGSQAISQLSDSVWGLERNQQDEGKKKNLIRLRVLKNRYSGETGIAGYLSYDKDTDTLQGVEDLSVFEDSPFDGKEDKGDF